MSEENTESDSHHTRPDETSTSLDTGLRPSDVWARLNPEQRERVIHTLVTVLLQLEQGSPEGDG